MCDEDAEVFNSDQCGAPHRPEGADRFRMQRLMQTGEDEISITTISQRTVTT